MGTPRNSLSRRARARLDRQRRPRATRGGPDAEHRSHAGSHRAPRRRRQPRVTGRPDPPSLAGPVPPPRPRGPSVGRRGSHLHRRMLCSPATSTWPVPTSRTATGPWAWTPIAGTAATWHNAGEGNEPTDTPHHRRPPDPSTGPAVFAFRTPGWRAPRSPPSAPMTAMMIERATGAVARSSSCGRGGGRKIARRLPTTIAAPRASTIQTSRSGPPRSPAPDESSAPITLSATFREISNAESKKTPQASGPSIRWNGANGGSIAPPSAPHRGPCEGR